MRDLARFARFVLVGAAGFVVDAGLSNLLVFAAHLSPLLSRIPAFCAATLVTYAAHRLFTFRDRRIGVLMGWLKYVASTSLGAVANYGVFTIMVAYVVHGPWAVLLAIAAGSIVGLGLNYVCSVKLVFRPSAPLR